MRNSVMILGVPVDRVTRAEALARISQFLREPEQHHVMTPNSEMIVEAQKNDAFKQLLNRTALNIPDSAGLLWAARRGGSSLPERVTGVDTVIDLAKQLEDDVPVFFLGSAEGIAAHAASILKARNPHLTVAGTFAGSPRPDEADDIIHRINASGAALLLVAFGAPTQDLWIDRYLPHMPHVRIAMGVGGTFDFIAGVRTRAPLFLQKLGLEWLWRLVKEPRRWKRIYNAVCVFPMLVLTKSTVNSEQ